MFSAACCQSELNTARSLSRESSQRVGGWPKTKECYHMSTCGLVVCTATDVLCRIVLVTAIEQVHDVCQHSGVLPARCSQSNNFSWREQFMLQHRLVHFIFQRSIKAFLAELHRAQDSGRQYVHVVSYSLRSSANTTPVPVSSDASVLPCSVDRTRTDAAPS